MGNTIKKLSLALGLITVAFGGYYIYIQQSISNDIAFDSEQSLQAMLARTSVFISHSQELDQINLDLTILEDQRFRSLKLYSRPVEDQPVGRANPFGSTY
jgi:hypothetical protein